MSLLELIRRELAAQPVVAVAPSFAVEHESAELTIPTTPCGACGQTAWQWHPDWPTPGTGWWRCATCTSLASVPATLTTADRARLEAEATSEDPLAHLVMRAVACAPEPCAWRLWSRRLTRGLWLCRDLAALRDLEREGLGGLPVVLADDLEHLRPLDDATLAAVLEMLTIFPGARVADVTPDASETVAGAPAR